MIDKDRDGIPDSVDIDGGSGTGVSPMQSAAQAAGLTFGDASADMFGGASAEEDAMVLVAEGVVLPQSDAKKWYEAQFVMNTPQAQEIRKALGALGYETDKEILYALDQGVDYAGNPFGKENPADPGNPFTWIFSGASRSPSRGSGGGGGGVSNSTTTSISESSRSQAGAILDQNFQSELGRTASKQEIIDFQQALNEQQRNNPTTTRSRTASGGGSVSASTQTQGGFDYTRFARQYAQKQPEFKDRYAAVQFMSLLDAAISDPNALDELVAGQ